VAYFLRYLKESVEKGRFKVREFRAGGGATSSDLWMRILADVLGKPLSLSAQPQPALVGNAMVAYTALGVYKDLKAAGKRMLKTGKRYKPDAKRAKVYAQAFKRFQEKLEKETR
jgi:ribulose kinase